MSRVAALVVLSLSVATFACSSSSATTEAPTDASASDGRSGVDAAADTSDETSVADAGADTSDLPACSGGGGNAIAAILTCSQPLSAACSPSCPPSSWSALDAWCSAHQGGRIDVACDGYLAYVEPIGVDGANYYFYEATTGDLTAVVMMADDQGWRCLGGDPTFALATRDCFVPDGLGHCGYGFDGGTFVECDAGASDAAASGD